MLTGKRSNQLRHGGGSPIEPGTLHLPAVDDSPSMTVANCNYKLQKKNLCVTRVLVSLFLLSVSVSVFLTDMARYMKSRTKGTD